MIKTVKSTDFAPERPMNVKSLGNVEIFEVVLDDGKTTSLNYQSKYKRGKLIDVNVTE